MAERYIRLFSLPGNQYTPGAPILISAGALLRDNQTGKILAQLKFKNISDKQIKAIMISVFAYDVSGKALESVSEYQYLDLLAKKNTEFGQKQAVTLPDIVTRSFEAKCTDVFFVDGSVWRAASDAIWDTLPAQVTIAEELGDLATQYQRDTSVSSKYIPMNYADLWRCSCGALNHEDETNCSACDQRKEDLFAALNPDRLQQRNAEYLAAEAEKAAKQAEARKTRCTKCRKFTIVAAAVIAVIVAVSLLVSNVVIPYNNYNKAVKLMEAGQYAEAVSAFEAMDGYKDSSDLKSICLENRYVEAHALMDAGDYFGAKQTFLGLGNYKESSAAVKYIDLITSGSLKNAQVGDYITFGVYEQDDNHSNGKEELEWVVLDVDNDSILLITSHSIDSIRYHNESNNVTWETSYIRRWLNNAFYDEAFSSYEKGLIIEATVPPGKNPESKIDPGNATKDKVFLLSVTEVEKYFPNERSRTCRPTHYAASKEEYISNGVGWLWLRSPGSETGTFANIRETGRIGYTFPSHSDFIRPVIWIKLQ